MFCFMWFDNGSRLFIFFIYLCGWGLKDLIWNPHVSGLKTDLQSSAVLKNCLRKLLWGRNRSHSHKNRSVRTRLTLSAEVESACFEFSPIEKMIFLPVQMKWFCSVLQNDCATLIKYTYCPINLMIWMNIVDANECHKTIKYTEANPYKALRDTISWH